MIKRTRAHWDVDAFIRSDPVAVVELSEAPEGNYSRLPNPNEDDEKGNPKYAAVVRVRKPPKPATLARFSRPPPSEMPAIEYDTYAREKVAHVSVDPRTGQRTLCTYWVWMPK